MYVCTFFLLLNSALGASSFQRPGFHETEIIKEVNKQADLIVWYDLRSTYALKYLNLRLQEIDCSFLLPQLIPLVKSLDSMIKGHFLFLAQLLQKSAPEKESEKLKLDRVLMDTEQFFERIQGILKVAFEPKTWLEKNIDNIFSNVFWTRREGITISGEEHVYVKKTKLPAPEVLALLSKSETDVELPSKEHEKIKNMCQKKVQNIKKYCQIADDFFSVCDSIWNPKAFNKVDLEDKQYAKIEKYFKRMQSGDTAMTMFDNAVSFQPNPDTPVANEVGKVWVLKFYKKFIFEQSAEFKDDIVPFADLKDFIVSKAQKIQEQMISPALKQSIEQFAREIENLSLKETREEINKIYNSGNLPEFIRQDAWLLIQLMHVFERGLEGMSAGRTFLLLSENDRSVAFSFISDLLKNERAVLKSAAENLKAWNKNGRPVDDESIKKYLQNSFLIKGTESTIELVNKTIGALDKTSMGKDQGYIKIKDSWESTLKQSKESLGTPVQDFINEANQKNYPKTFKIISVVRDNIMNMPMFLLKSYLTHLTTVK